MSVINPYEGNILVDPLGPIVDHPTLIKQIATRPPLPGECSLIPKYLRRHYLPTLWELFVPPLESIHVVETIDLMIRQGYRYRDPNLPRAWSMLLGEPSPPPGRVRAPATAAVVVGHSGVGKTETILRALGRYPQVITHESFPNLMGAHKQITWLSVEVPASGRSYELAANLMNAWDEAVLRADPKAAPRFPNKPGSRSHNPLGKLDEWRQVALTHSLGILHLDEVQNFFKLLSLKSRRSRTASGDRELSIVEDQVLRWILSLTNTWQIPLLLSGTPDGVSALTRRLSNTQRFVASGYHHIKPFSGPEDPVFLKNFMPELLKHQWVVHRLEDSRELRELIIDLTAGIRRLIIALWIGAQRVALERSDYDGLRLEDIEEAGERYLAPVRP